MTKQLITGRRDEERAGLELAESVVVGTDNCLLASIFARGSI